MPVSKLRFKDKDGKDFPEWKNIILGIISKKVISKNKDMAIKLVLTNSATKGVVKQEDFFDREIVSDTNLDSYFIISKDDFVYNPRISVTAPVGPIKRNKLETGVMSPLYTIFRFNKANLSFLESYFQTSHWHKYMKSVANSGARFDRMNITDEDFFNLPIPFPCPNEQAKIADFLTTLDTRINQQEKQCQLLEQYKKGIMQQIFNQQLRFKDDNGKEFPEWNSKPLARVAKLTSSKRVHLAEYVKEGIPFFRGKEISDLKSGKPLTDILYISKGMYDNFKKTFGVPRKNDILITAVGTIANTYLVKGDFDFYFKDGNLIWLTDIRISSEFLIYLLDASKEEIIKTAIGSSQKALTIISLNKLSISFPKSEKEQTKIANFLTAIDDKINLAKAQLEQLNTYKKGLLQQLFI